MEYVICREFPSLSPFILEEKEYGEVIELFADLRDMQIRNENKDPEVKQQKGTTVTEKNGHKIIRRPASDSWF